MSAWPTSLTCHAKIPSARVSASARPATRPAGALAWRFTPQTWGSRDRRPAPRFLSNYNNDADLDMRWLRKLPPSGSAAPLISRVGASGLKMGRAVAIFESVLGSDDGR